MDCNKYIGLTIDDCVEILQNANKDQQYDKESISFDIKPLSDTLQGFGAEHFILTIIYKTQGQKLKESKNSKFFLKNSNGNSDLIVMMTESMNAYEKEAFLYNNFFKEGEGMGMDCSFAPKGYFARPSFLIMEDVSPSGYRTGNKLQPLDVGQCRAVLDALAKFHMFVVIYEYEKRKINIDYSLANVHKDIVSERVQKDGKADVVERSFQGTMDGLLATIDLLSEEDGIDKDMFKIRLNAYLRGDGYLTDFYDDLKPKKGDLCCLLHNDLWCNNFMFLYPPTSDGSDSSENNIDGSTGVAGADPIDCKLIDYQLLSYGSPALDVMRTIHTNTRKETRDKHKEELLRHYFQSTIQCLEKYGLSPDKLSNWTWDIFSSTCNRVELAIKLRSIAGRSMTFQPGSIWAKRAQEPDVIERMLFSERVAIMQESYTDTTESGELYRTIIDEDMHELWKMLSKRD